MNLTDLIAAAPWREAVTFRETWPHEYVLLKKDGERELMQAVCQRVRDGEAFRGYFFRRQMDYYWFKSVIEGLGPDRWESLCWLQFRVAGRCSSHVREAIHHRVD